MTNHTYLPDADDTPETEAYRLYCEEQEAIHFGTATELMECYLCVPLDAPKPLRGVLSRSCNMKAADPTEAYHLSCGHTII